MNIQETSLISSTSYILVMSNPTHHSQEILRRRSFHLQHLPHQGQKPLSFVLRHSPSPGLRVILNPKY